jgi:hypothetical protein
MHFHVPRLVMQLLPQLLPSGWDALPLKFSASQNTRDFASASTNKVRKDVNLSGIPHELLAIPTR